MAVSVWRLFVLTGILILVTTPGHAQLTGRIVDALSGEPVSGAVVTWGNQEVRSGEDGWFTHPQAEDRIRVRAAGYRRFDAPASDGCDISLQPFAPKAVYLSFWGIGAAVLRDPALDLIASSELNALVIDVKGDRGQVPYPSEVKLAHQIGADKLHTVSQPQRLLARLKAQGIYTIARIVTFKDNLLAEAHPEWAVKTADGELWRDREGLAWVDPFNPEVWAYNAALAVEAARLGFDEIQFDYVRFPDQGGAVFSFEADEASRVFAISRFLHYARRQLRCYNVFLAADIFGYVCWNRNDTDIGQRLEDLADEVDYLSPMLYPSGFQYGVGDYRNPVANPYEIVYLSLKQGGQRSGLDRRRFRPWLQAFRDYAFDHRSFGPTAVGAQTRAAESFGSSGWMLWNPRNVYRNLGLADSQLQIGLSHPTSGDGEG